MNNKWIVSPPHSALFGQPKSEFLGQDFLNTIRGCTIRAVELFGGGFLCMSFTKCPNIKDSPPTIRTGTGICTPPPNTALFGKMSMDFPDQEFLNTSRGCPIRENESGYSFPGIPQHKSGLHYSGGCTIWSS